MKYTIEGFSQEYALQFKKNIIRKNKQIEIKLDCTDLVVLRWFVDFYPKMKKIIVDGKEYAWLTHKKLLEDLPLIDISKDGFISRMQKLVEFEILDYVFLKENGSFSLYTFGKNYGGMVSNTQGVLVQTSTGVGVQTSTKDNTITDNSIKNNNKEENKSTAFDDIINNYTENETLRTALAEFIQKRKKMNKPIEPSGLQRLLTKQNSGLFTISNGNDNLAIDIVHQSVDNCWLGFFPLKTQKVEKRQESIAERIARL